MWMWAHSTLCFSGLERTDMCVEIEGNPLHEQQSNISHV